MKKMVLAAVVFAMVALAVAAQTAKPTTTGTFTDPRDGKTYRIVKIGTQTWMAENLNYKTDRSKCYIDDSSYCEKYGRLYYWVDALTACPTGWHLPMGAELTMLENTVGGRGTAGKKLKSTSGWYNKDNNTNGTDEYGFSALPGGYGYSVDGDSDCDCVVFLMFINNGFWWSATEYNADKAWFWGMYDEDENVGWHYRNKDYLYYVRCVRDN